MADFIFEGAVLLIVTFIAGAMPWVSIIMGKELKVSEFRQAWINALREDVAIYAGVINRAASAVDSYRFHNREVLSDKDKKNLFSKFEKSIFKLAEELHETSYRITLRLNPKETDLLDKMEEMEKMFNDPVQNMKSTGEVHQQVDELIGKFHKLLKTEWEVVKKGESIFVGFKDKLKTFCYILGSAILLMVILTTLFLL